MSHPSLTARRAVPTLFERAWAAVGDPRVAVAVIVIYIAFHLLTRLLISSNFMADEAELYLLAQSWRASYELHHPPLLIWIVRAVLDVTNDSPEAFHVLRYALLGAGLFAFLAAAREVLCDTRLALFALLALLATKFFVFWVHVDMTFSLLMMTANCLMIFYFVRVVRNGRSADYGGLCFALILGLWSKYIFVALFLELIVAAIVIPGVRRRIAWPKLASIAAIAFLISAPVYILPLSVNYSILYLAHFVVTAGADPSFQQSDHLTWSVLAAPVAAFIFGAPFAIPIYLLHPRVLRAMPPAAPDSTLERAIIQMLQVAMGIGFFGSIVAAAYLNVPSYSDIWIFPFLVALPIVLLYRANATGAPANRLLFLAAGFAAFVSAAGVARLAAYEYKTNFCAHCTLYWPASEFASRISALGFSRGTIVSDDVVIPATLRQSFRDSRAIALGLTHAVHGYNPAIFGPPMPRPGQWLIVWDGSDPPESLSPYLSLPEAKRPIARGRITIPLDPRIPDKTATLGYVLYRR